MRKILSTWIGWIAQGVSRSKGAFTSLTPVVASVKKSQKKLNPKYSMAKLWTGWYGIVHACTLYKLPQASSGQSLTRPDIKEEPPKVVLHPLLWHNSIGHVYVLDYGSWIPSPSALSCSKHPLVCSKRYNMLPISISVCYYIFCYRPSVVVYLLKVELPKLVLPTLLPTVLGPS